MVVHLYCSGGRYFEERVKFDNCGISKRVLYCIENMTNIRVKYCVTILKGKDARDGDSEKVCLLYIFEEEAKVGK